jgi:UDP-N-acetylmuramyl pentapeptide synthase
MAQSSEYRSGPYLKWYWRVSDFSRVAHRRNLELTTIARLLLFILRLGILAQVLAGSYLIWQSYTHYNNSLLAFGLLVLISYPIVWAHLMIFPLFLGRKLIIEPRDNKLIAQSKDIFGKHPGVIVAVAGSYGKTTMKELLVTVLSEGKSVVATPGNKNVPVSHAIFARKLTGEEEIIIIEYGEGEPGDVPRFAQTTQPDYGFITGIAPAHIDQYKTLEAAAKDIFGLADYLLDEHIYVNAESSSAQPYIKPTHTTYSSDRVADWEIKDIGIKPNGVSFVLEKADRRIELTSGLLGKHQVGPLAAVAAFALSLGLTDEQVKSGIAKTVPYEHRMQPRSLPGNIWIIDDTYNGNIEGMKAGLELLAAIPAKRRVYVTPGLVDQGDLSESVHQHLGTLIAANKPDVVVLMQNSATANIQHGMTVSGYGGKIIIEDDPLGFYTHIDQFVAAGDVVMMQNDWTDNYS